MVGPRRGANAFLRFVRCFHFAFVEHGFARDELATS